MPVARMSKRALCLSYRFPPQSYPVATRVEYVLNHLDGWQVDAVTAAESPQGGPHVTPHSVPCPAPEKLFSLLQSLRLGKMLDWVVWPDTSIFWLLPAYRKAHRLAQARSYDALIVFMMPYAPGLAGLALKRKTGLPLVLNLDDSPTCSDLHPTHPSRLHHRLAREIEDLYARHADALVYVSRRNMVRIRNRQPAEHRSKFHLVRWGSQPLPTPTASNPQGDDYHIVYTGGTSGWYRFLDEEPAALPMRFAKQLFRTWKQAGRYEVTPLDPRTHGPVYVGRAVQQVLHAYPEWEGRVHVDVYGERYPKPVTDTVLDRFGLQDIVHLHGRVPHDEALRRMTEADLLFMALPDRLDGSPGGRISAKTYEYLTTDRPILAALPPGENREYLQDKPGVHLAPPDGVGEMADILNRLIAASFDGDSLAVDRSDLRPQISSTARAKAFERVLNSVVATPAPAVSR